MGEAGGGCGGGGRARRTQLAAVEGGARSRAPELRPHAGSAPDGRSRARTTTGRRPAQADGAQVGEIRATIERKTIRAPFSGILGIRQVNLGQYLAGGDPVVPLQSLNPIYVNFGVPQQQAAQLSVGREVRVTPGDLASARSPDA